VEIERRRRAARGGVWFLCILALTVTGVATFGAVLAAGYTHEGSSLFSTAGNVAQVAVALAGLGLAIGAVTALTLDKPRLGFMLALVATAAGVAWWPVWIALSE
jgi:hypothetical protein